MLNTHILHLTFALVGTVDSDRESSVIPNRVAFKDLLCDLEVNEQKMMAYCNGVVATWGLSCGTGHDSQLGVYKSSLDFPFSIHFSIKSHELKLILNVFLRGQRQKNRSLFWKQCAQIEFPRRALEKFNRILIFTVLSRTCKELDKDILAVWTRCVIELK